MIPDWVPRLVYFQAFFLFEQWLYFQIFGRIVLRWVYRDLFRLCLFYIEGVSSFELIFLLNFGEVSYVCRIILIMFWIVSMKSKLLFLTVHWRRSLMGVNESWLVDRLDFTFALFRLWMSFSFLFALFYNHWTNWSIINQYYKWDRIRKKDTLFLMILFPSVDCFMIPSL